MRTSVLRIANGAGYWGDDPDAVTRQLAGPAVDYLTLDYLAETTMSILQKQRAADPRLGYAHDFIGLVAQNLKRILQQGTCLIANAGGVNPRSCAEEVAGAAKALGVAPRIAVVYGDDILPELPSLVGKGHLFSHLDSGEPLAPELSRVAAANVYFGAKPIVEALAGGANIIITGRVADAALALAPMVHEFGWKWTDWDRLAAGVVAGHILECGAQATGGNFSDWRKVKSFRKMGYPIVEVEANGEFVVTKPTGSGGLVAIDTVREQLVYEIGNPHAYLTPDVVADFTSIRLEQLGEDRVRVSGARGFEPTDSFKVSIACEAGFKCAGGVLVSGPEAREKAEAYADLFWSECTGFEETRTEYFGVDALQGPLTHAREGNEILLRLSARAREKRALLGFAKRIPSLILSGPPGLTYTGGVPKVEQVMRFWPALLSKAVVRAKVSVGSEEKTVEGGLIGNYRAGTPSDLQVATRPQEKRDADSGVALSVLCLARSGDKGDTANIGVLARGPRAYAFLKEKLTAQQVKDWFQEICEGRVLRYEMESLLGFNFLLERSLGGGGMASLRLDSLGKSFGQALLRQKIQAPPDLPG